MGPLLVFGASGHGLVVADTAVRQGYDPVVFADDDPAKAGTSRMGLPVVACGVEAAAAWIGARDGAVVVAIGTNATRARVLEAFVAAGASVATVIDPSAVVSRGATVGAGTVVFAGVVVQAEARVGANVILNTGCSVDHECRLGDHVHVSPGAHLGGQVVVGEGTHIGIGACVIQCRRIGAWSTVGAGAAVVRDLPDRVVAVGVPARVRRPA